MADWQKRPRLSQGQEVKFAVVCYAENKQLNSVLNLGPGQPCSQMHL